MRQFLSVPFRRAVLGWLAYAALCAAFIAIEWGTNAAGRRYDLNQLREDSIARQLEDYIRIHYPSRDLIPEMESALNSGRPLPRQRLDRSVGWFDRIVLDGSAIYPRCRGWIVQIDYSATPGAIWTYITALPPPARAGFIGQIGSPTNRHLAEQLRKFVLILSALVWLMGMMIAPVAGPHRRRLGQIAAAAAALALLAWAADPLRPSVASLPPVNWIFIPAAVALLIGVLAAAIPSRNTLRRPDRCSNCNYDLTGNVSGACPECGQPTPAEARRRRDADLTPLAQAIESTQVSLGEDSEMGDTESNGVEDDQVVGIAQADQTPMPR